MAKERFEPGPFARETFFRHHTADTNHLKKTIEIITLEKNKIDPTEKKILHTF